MAKTLYGELKSKKKPKTAKKFFYRWKDVEEDAPAGRRNPVDGGNRFRLGAGGGNEAELRPGWRLDGGGNPVKAKNNDDEETEDDF